jgi:ABC-type branched-subunit amino acid transport system ATPase component
VAEVIVGIPAIRLSGLYLAAATMTFAVPVSTFLLNSTYFPRLTPARIARPALLRRFDLNSALVFCWFCAAILVLALVLARNYRHSRAGRVALAVRDNERGAAAFGVSPVRVRLVAFAFAGALAGVGGGLYAIALKGIGFSGYNPELSFQVFAMVVVGGLGSLSGGVLGAFYVYGAQFFLHGAMQLLATGAGILFVVLILPGGLADLLYRGRDRALRAIAARRGLSVPSLAETAAFADASTAPLPVVAVDDAAASDVLRLEGVAAAYGTVPVLFGVDLHVSAGEIVGLLGTNGAGKSTALRVASGLLPATAGRVVYAGQDITDQKPVERVRAGLAMVPSGRSVFPSLTVAENLRLGGWMLRRDQAAVDAATERVLTLFPRLRERLNTLAGSLSGGEQQMLTIAQTLYCQPKVLMIDELSLGLSPTVVGELLGVVRELAANGVTVVVVEQSLNVATSVANRSVFMERGQVRFSGATADLASRDDLLRSVFLGKTAGPARAAKPKRAARAADTAPAFEVGEVSRTFGGVRALSDVSLAAYPGEILGIIGANGAGKTTLFDICSGFTAPSRGHVRLGGVEVTDLPAHVRADLGLGRIFQDARLFPSLPVREAIAVAFERHIDTRDPLLSMFHTGAIVDAEADVTRGVARLIERFGLERYADAFVSELSTGTRRVVEIACVLAHDPSVLLLDEPTSGIAQRESEALARLLVDIRDETGATFVIIEHDVPLVSSISDRLICLHLGEVIAEGAPADVLANPEVIAAYLGEDQAAIARSNSATKKRPRRVHATHS